MRRSILLVTIFFAPGVWGCGGSTAPTANTVTLPGFFDQDPVARAAGQYVPQESNQPFDIGIASYYIQDFNGALTPGGDSSEASMAFENGSLPAQVIAARLNDISLPWYAPSDSLTYWCNLYRSSNPSLFSSADSLGFSYSGFDGSDFTSRTKIASQFGAFGYFDTISALQGFHFQYQNSRTGDSIVVRIYGVDTGTIDVLWTLPDTGAFSIAPHLLNYVKGGMNDYSIQVYREHWQQLTSPAGKRIGIYSRASTTEGFFIAKP